MKRTSNHWKLTVTALLSVAGAVWAVSPDVNAPCWRDQTGTTRQVWTFDSGANPIAPSFKTNQPASPLATLTFTDNTSEPWVNSPGGTPVIAFLPLGRQSGLPRGAVSGFESIPVDV